VVGESCETILGLPAQAADFRQLLEDLQANDRRGESVELRGPFIRIGDARFAVTAQRVPGPGAQHSILLMLKESN
jgi:hypothetical protein